MLRAANGPLSCIGFYTELAEVPREVSPPLAQRRFVDIQSFAPLAYRFDDHVHMWVSLVSVQSHRVSMLRAELLRREFPYRLVELRGSRPLGIENTML